MQHLYIWNFWNFWRAKQDSDIAHSWAEWIYTYDVEYILRRHRLKVEWNPFDKKRKPIILDTTKYMIISWVTEPIHSDQLVGGTLDFRYIMHNYSPWNPRVTTTINNGISVIRLRYIIGSRKCICTQIINCGRQWALATDGPYWS